MAGIDSKTGSFKAPQMPLRNRAKAKGPAIRSVTKQTPASKGSAATKTSETKTEKPELKQEVFHSKQDLKKLHQDVKHQRAGADSFQAREKTAEARKSTQLSNFASKVVKDKDKKAKAEKAKQFAQSVNKSKIGKQSRAVAVESHHENTKASNQQVAANAGQVHASQEKDKKSQSLEKKLDKIFTQGGDKGKGFVAFVKREMQKGPLPDSITELVEGFLQTLKGDSLTASEMISSAEEPLIVLRGMVSADNLEEQSLIQDSLASSIINSAGERADLMRVRNQNKSEIKLSAPTPSYSKKTNPMDKAISYIMSINLGAKTAPWDGVKHKRSLALAARR